MKRPELAGLAPLFGCECRIALRAPAFWGVAAACAVLSAWRAMGAGTTSALAAYRACEIMVVGLGLVAVFLSGSAAGRDRRGAAEGIVLAKPRGSAPLLAGMRYVALWLSLMVIAAISLGAASAAQVAGGRTAWHAYPYVHALARVGLPVGVAAALGFCLSTVFHTPLASAVAAIYWLVVPLSRQHLASAFDLAVAQHRMMAAFAAALLVVLACMLYARPVRGRSADGRWLTAIAALLLIGLLVSTYGVVTNGEDMLTGPDPVLAAMASQSIHASGRAPGFWLKDANGRIVGLSDYANRPVLLAFWAPGASGSAELLALVGAMAKEFGPRGLACIAVSVDRDAGTLRPFAQEAPPGVPVVWDRGRHFGEGNTEADTPMSVAYDVTQLPSLFLLDRERRLSGKGPVEPNERWLRREISRLVAR